MPWLHLHVDTTGRVKACCEANITFGNVNEQPLQEIWQGEPIRQFRKSLMNEKKDNRCASCFTKEAAGKKSMRTETLENFSHRLDWVNETDSKGVSVNSKPIYFDIRFNNLCNLRCRTCWHGASSSWFDEAKHLKQNFGEKAIIEASKDSQSFIRELLDQDVAVEEIYFAGGEPLMMREHYNWLEGLIDNGQTSVHLRYNTNLSVLSLQNRSVLELWKNFRKVTVSASIDGMGKEGEYVRKGLNWERFVGNMRMIKTNLPHVKLEIAPTISVFNIGSLDALHRHFVDEGLVDINAIYLNILSRPDYYNIKILHEGQKQEVGQSITEHLKWMNENGATEALITEFESVIAYMNHEDWTHLLPKLKKQLALLDNIRSESYESLFPDIKKAFDLA